MEGTKFEKATIGEKVSNFLNSRRVIFTSVLVVAVVAVVVYAVSATLITKSNEKGLESIDGITYKLTKDSVNLSEEELEARRTAALDSLTALVKKGGVVGVRANILAGEITYSQKKYDDAAKYWVSAAAKGKKSYTAPLAYFNAATCYEELGNLPEAIVYYEKAASAKDFGMASHAEFNLARVKEANGDAEGALEAYNSVVEKYPNDSWAALAKSRIIALSVNK